VEGSHQKQEVKLNFYGSEDK